MNEMKVFENEQFGQVRTVMVDNEPWFVAKDICRAFDDKNHIRSVGRVDDMDKRMVTLTDAMGRKQTATAVNESGMYALLFAMQPQKANKDGVSDAYPIDSQRRIENLRNFKRWITHEVIPAIRKQGMYATPQTMEALLSNPEFMFEVMKNYMNERSLRKEAEQQNVLLIETNEQLTIENRILNGQVFAWDFSSLLNALIRAYAGKAKGNQFGIAWNQFYSEIKNGRRLNLEKRRTEASKKDAREKKRPLYQFIRKDEELSAIQTVIAMCDHSKVTVNDILVEHINVRADEAV